MMTTQTAIPPAVREVLRRAQRRFSVLPLDAQPNLESPTSACGLFARTEMMLLSQHGYWPLPEAAIDLIDEPPGK